VNDPVNRPVRYGPYPELTWPAVIVGWILGLIICVSIGYAALVLGFSIEGSELAAILGWGLLRGVLRRSSIVENNINQTIASAVNGASAGMMFSIPALFILARSDPEKYGEVTGFSTALMVLACMTGGIIGLAFVIPLRKQMIDFNRLAYPGGIAVAAILKSPGAGMRKAALLLAGAAVAGSLNVLMLVLFGDQPDLALGKILGLPSWLNLAFFVSLMTIGVGFLSGRGGMVFGYGGLLCYFVLSPLLIGFGSPQVQEILESGAASVPNTMRSLLFRPTGIGMLIGAAVAGIFAAFPLVRSAFRSMRQAREEKGLAGADEMPIGLLGAAVVGGGLILTIIATFSVPNVGLFRGLAMAALGTLWIWIAGVIVSECVGRTNWNPISGMTLIAVTILLFVTSGLSTTSAVVSSVLVGAAICVAIAQAGDMMLDLKSGYLVGARPRLQQYAQFLGAWLGPIVVMILIYALDRTDGLGSEKLPAAQGQALASVITAIIGGDVPTWRYLAGGGLGALLAVSGLGGIGVMIGLGFYMPFNIVLTYTLGCLLRMAVEKMKGLDFVHEVGIPVAAGLIVGEALVGVGNAFYKILFVGGG